MTIDIWIKVARYQLMTRLALWIPWAALASSLAINLILFAVIPDTAVPNPQTWGLVTIYCFLFIIGLQSTTRMLPFAFALGLTRRAYFSGTALLGLGLAAADGLALTVLQAVERATGGWGENLGFFRLPWILDGPWYITWLTSFVALSLVFVYGAWFGLVYRRWNLVGLLAFVAGQAGLLVAGALVMIWVNAWPELGHFFTTLSAVGLTGILAVLAAALLAGGFTTMRHVTV